MLIKVIITLIAVLITFYGLLKKNRVYFNVGYFVTGIIITIDQLVLFFQNSATIHMAVAALWSIQTLLAIPNKLPYDGSKLAKSAAIKIFATYSIINGFGVYYVLAVDYIPNEAMYSHLLFALLPLFSSYLILSNKIKITQ